MEPVSDEAGDLQDVMEEYFAIHEVYYDEYGYIAFWSENEISPSGDSLYWLKWDLQKMLEATEKPIINIEDLKVGVKL